MQRILIVGDFHIPQCVRYRIEQKIEQQSRKLEDIQNTFKKTTIQLKEEIHQEITDQKEEYNFKIKQLGNICDQKFDATASRINEITNEIEDIKQEEKIHTNLQSG